MLAWSDDVVLRLTARFASVVLVAVGVGTALHGYYGFVRKGRIVRRAQRVASKAEGIRVLNSALIRPLGTLVKVVMYKVNFRGTQGGDQNQRMNSTTFSCKLHDVDVAINPQKMELDLENTITKRNQQVQESVLRASGPIFVVGILTSSNDEEFYIDGRPLGWSLLSYRSEAELLGEYDFWGTVYTVSSVSATGAALVLLVFSFWGNASASIAQL